MAGSTNYIADGFPVFQYFDAMGAVVNRQRIRCWLAFLQHGVHAALLAVYTA
jgi:hypothetical protein